ncbi:MAG TPA: substrate-binding domain-containing protein [Burkholderiales bacterium]|nr:substrate-binding domain-containing protein [Burkholderiales bacterium]
MKVFSSLAIKAAYQELVPQFEKSSGRKVDTEWVGMADIRKRLGAGETPDLVIGSAALIDEFVSAGTLKARTNLGQSGVAVAVRKGAPRPDISSADAVKRALLNAKSIVYSSGPSGVYLATLFDKWGITEQMKKTALQTPPGVLVAELVAKGERELCFQQMPELLQVSGIDIVGPLPAEIQTMTTFSAGIHAKAKDADTAAALVKFLTSPDARPVMQRRGLEAA